MPRVLRNYEYENFSYLLEEFNSNKSDPTELHSEEFTLRIERKFQCLSPAKKHKLYKSSINKKDIQCLSPANVPGKKLNLKIIEEVTMKKCRYCGKELDSNLEFCSSECENSYRKIIEKDRHKTKYFISGIILGFLVMFYGVVSSRNCMLGSGIIVMGVIVVLLPFTTPETTVLFGNKKARFIGRILGMLLIAVGIWVGFI